VVGLAQTGLSVYRAPPSRVEMAGAGRLVRRPLPLDLAVTPLHLYMPGLALSWKGVAQALRVEGPVLLHQGLPSVVINVLRSALTLVQNVPLYMCDLPSPQSRNKDPRTSAAT